VRKQLTALLLTAALAALLFVPAVGASGTTESIDGNLTFATFDTSSGTVRGVIADLELTGFTVEEIDDSQPGGVVVRLYDAANSSRTISQVTLQKNAVSAATGTKLTAPIDSVWGDFDYAADGNWTQPRNLRINGGNCERIGGAEVTIQLTRPGGPVTGTIEGSPSGSCNDIRR